MAEDRSKDILKASLAFSTLLPGPWAASNLVHILLIDIANEVPASAIMQLFPDESYADAAAEPNFVLDRSTTDNPRFPNSLNALQNKTINQQLKHCALLEALSTSVNRYYTALARNSAAAASTHLRAIKMFFTQAHECQEIVVKTFKEFASALRSNSSLDTKINKHEVKTFQSRYLEEDMPADLSRLYKSLLSKANRNILKIWPPMNEARRWILGIRADEVPTSFSAVISGEASVISNISSVIGPFPGIHFSTTRVIPPDILRVPHLPRPSPRIPTRPGPP